MLPTETSRLTNLNDREVPHFLHWTFCSANQRSIAAIMAAALRELFAHALERMKELPPEPANPPALATVPRLAGRG